MIHLLIFIYKTETTETELAESHCRFDFIGSQGFQAVGGPSILVRTVIITISFTTPTIINNIIILIISIIVIIIIIVIILVKIKR